jgi:D-glycero-D-manno-heptose 1,7-bisphosphate phosphatase
MILDAKKEFNVDLKNSWLVGDKESDILAALNSGITNTILLRSGHKINEKNTKAKFIANNLLEGVTLIQEGKLL